jgi:UDP-3-O-[3-hydroxymyristoyl] glucosamine N-acyltransferase
MPRASSCLRAVTAVVLITVGAVAPAKAASWLEKSFFMSGANYSNQLPPCEAALDAISAQFAQKESRFWNSDLQIVSFARVRQVAYNAWAPGTIPRRYCRAEALVSDGRRHRVNFWIGEDTSLIGFAPAVEWCVVGLDRNWAYNPACKMALP